MIPTSSLGNNRGVRMGPTWALFRGQFTCAPRLSGRRGNSIPVNRKSLRIKDGGRLIMHAAPRLSTAEARFAALSNLSLWASASFVL